MARKKGRAIVDVARGTLTLTSNNGVSGSSIRTSDEMVARAIYMQRQCNGIMISYCYCRCCCCYCCYCCCCCCCCWLDSRDSN